MIIITGSDCLPLVPTSRDVELDFATRDSASTGFASWSHRPDVRKPDIMSRFVGCELARYDILIASTKRSLGHA